MIEDRNIRIFLSSTFADMQEERNYLVKKTLPALYAECKKRNVDVSVVDLRWGITEEESKTGKVIEICLDEIERTRPFFIGIVGGRYGWIPNESEFKINEHLLLKYPWLKKDIGDGLSITELEMQYGALKNSENVKSFFYLRELESVSREFREKEGTVEFGRLIKLRSSIESAANEGKCQLTSYKTTRSLGEAVYRQLIKLVEELYPIKEDNQWAIIDQKQRAIIARLSKTYYKRNDILFEDSSKRFPDEINTDTDNFILLYGEGGFGKTSLLSVEIGNHINKIPVYHAIIDDEINSTDKLYRLLLYQISQDIIDFKCPEISEKDKMIDLNKILSNKLLHPYRFYWVIDGLDRLASSEDLSMNWLNSLPSNISLILSTSEISIISKIRSICKDKDSKLCIIPSLNASSIMGITSSYLKNLSKVLTTQQRSHICAHPLLVNPRLLVLFLNEIATFGVYEMLNHYIDKFIATDNLDDFLTVFLNRMEEDFGKERVHDVLSLLCLSNIGMTEQQLRDYLDIPPIDFYSIMNAIDPIVNKENSHLHIATGEIKNSIYQRICSIHKCKERALRNYIIECRTRESNILIELRNYPFWYRTVIRMLNGQWMFASNGNEYFRINSEIRHQLALTGQKRKLYVISKNFGIGLLDSFTFSVLKGYEDGLYGLLSIWALPILFKYDRDTLDAYLKIVKTNTNQNQQELFKNKLKCLFLFPKCRKFILNELQGNDTPNEDFEDQWTKENYMQIDPLDLTVIANQIIHSTFYNKGQINSMLQKAAPIVADENLKMEDECTYANYCLICCCCCLRLNNISEAIRYYSLQETCCGGYLGNRNPILRFMLSLKSKDFATCSRIIEEFGDVNDVETIFNKTRCNIMLMDAKAQDSDDITAYMKSVAKAIDANEDRLSVFFAVGNYLYMWEIKQYAKEAFLIALSNSNADIDKQIICYVNLANCCDDSTESINFLKKRIELAKSKYGEKWDDELLDCYLDYLGKLRKTSPQTACDEIAVIIATYNDLTDKAKSSLYHLKAGCYGDMYDKTNDEEIYSKGLILLNKALEFTSAQTDDYYGIIASRLAYLLRKKESPFYIERLKQDQIIMENGINLSSEDIRDEIRKSLLELYLDTEQMTEACKFYDSCPNTEIFSTWQRQKINEYHSNNTELVSIAEEKIQRIKTWLKKSEIVEVIQWIVDEKKNGYDFELVKHILQNWIKERKDVAYNKYVLNIFDVMANKGLAIPDAFYREYLFEPNMASVILQETNASWSLESTTNKKTFPNDGDVISHLEDNRKEILERGCQRLFSLCHDFNLSEDDYIKVFINYSTILGEHLHKLLDLIQSREDAADILVQFLNSSPFKSYDICKQVYSEIERIKPLVEENSDLENIISDVIDDCAYDMFKDGDKADCNIDILLGIVDVLNIKKLGNYTLYMIIQAKYYDGDWSGIISTYSDYCIQANDTVSFFITIYAAQSYANIGDKENAENLFGKLLNTEGEYNFFATETYAMYLLQHGKYPDCNNLIVSYLNVHQDKMSTDVLVEFWKILSTVKLYVGEYEQALKLLDMFQQNCEKDEKMVDSIRKGRIYRLIIFYVRQGLDNDALSIYQKTNDFEHMGFSDLKIRAYIELSRMYTRLNEHDNALEMKEKAMACMSEYPYYLKELEDLERDFSKV